MIVVCIEKKATVSFWQADVSPSIPVFRLCDVILRFLLLLLLFDHNELANN